MHLLASIKTLLLVYLVCWTFLKTEVENDMLAKQCFKRGLFFLLDMVTSWNHPNKTKDVL